MTGNLDIEEIIKNKDEKKLKDLTILLLKSVVDGTEDKNELSYMSSFFITVPQDLGWKDNFKITDKLLGEAWDLITNFEGDTEEEAKEKSRKMLEKLKEE